MTIAFIKGMKRMMKRTMKRNLRRTLRGVGRNELDYMEVTETCHKT